MQPLITVIMATYNTERYVAKAIESVLQQTFFNFELLIVDDGSTDKSAEIIDEYAKKDKRITVVHQENCWIFPTYNRAVQMARGQYVTICNSDDVLVPDALETISHYITKYHVDVVFENVSSNTCDEKQNIITRDFQHSVMNEEFVVIGKENIRRSWATFMAFGLVRNNANTYRTEILRKHPYREDIYGADFMMNIDIASEINSAACSPKDLYIHYVYQNSATLNASVGKYTPYEHDMFNEFYTKYVALFESWGLYTEEIKNFLCNLRVSQLQTEYSNLFVENCPLTVEERISELLSKMDDVVFYCSTKLGKFEEEEEKILLLSLRIMNNQKSGSSAKWNKVLKLLFESTKDQRRLAVLKQFISSNENPNHLGLAQYEKAARDCFSKSNRAFAAYLRLKREAKFFFLDNDVAEMKKIIAKLEHTKYDDPEKISILSGVYFALGEAEKTLAFLKDGLEKFPDDQDLMENYQLLSNLIGV